MEIPKLHHSEEFKEIYAAFIKAQSEFTAVPKNREARVKSKRTGAEFSYKYADLADVLAMALPVLTRHGIGLLQPHLMVEGKLRVCTMLIHTSGQWLSSSGLELTEGDDPQEFGADSTYFRRYDVCTMLGITADEDIDAQQEKRAKPAQVRALPKEKSPESGPSADAALDQRDRDELIRKLKSLVPDPQELGHRAHIMFPEHKSTKSLTVADLEKFYEAILAERRVKDHFRDTPVGDIPEDVAAMFDDGVLTTASRIKGPVIGVTRAKRLQKLLELHKLHTEAELLSNLKPLGVLDITSIPMDMYEEFCAWAEGKREGVEVEA